MQLHDPTRPTLSNGRPTFLRGSVVIPRPEIWPSQSGQFEVSIFLPIRDGTFSSKRFTTSFISIHDFISFMHNFHDDPEYCCEQHFKANLAALQPELRKQPKLQKEPSENQGQNLRAKTSDRLRPDLSAISESIEL